MCVNLERFKIKTLKSMFNSPQILANDGQIKSSMGQVGDLDVRRKCLLLTPTDWGLTTPDPSTPKNHTEKPFGALVNMVVEIGVGGTS
ncbi:hypothetical protein GWI33_015058 [Rhynchophorus ferrugineus]|uniref:Uncharacterized protein n=1 Tax=Rhynchophorus ferrugineus TaxID=354439 RepID=A0A834M6B6_RHYFE|nr:hypothetical protein GWI33_015058 [Rhynchophorus ferrugineus]